MDITTPDNLPPSQRHQPIADELDAVEADPQAMMIDQDATTVVAMQVNMDRSGADQIKADKVFLTNSGAQTIASHNVRLTQSGVVRLTGEEISLNQSSVLANGSQHLVVNASAIGINRSESVTVGDGSRLGIAVADTVRASGDLSAFAIFANDVSAGGHVNTTFTRESAAAAGAAFAVTMFLLSRLFGRRDA